MKAQETDVRAYQANTAQRDVLFIILMKAVCSLRTQRKMRAAIALITAAQGHICSKRQ